MTNFIPIIFILFFSSFWTSDDQLSNWGHAQVGRVEFSPNLEILLLISLFFWKSKSHGQVNLNLGISYTRVTMVPFVFIAMTTN